MKVSTENDKNGGYEKITIVVDNIPLNKLIFLIIVILVICQIFYIAVHHFRSKITVNLFFLLIS